MSGGEAEEGVDAPAGLTPAAPVPIAVPAARRMRSPLAVCLHRCGHTSANREWTYIFPVKEPDPLGSDSLLAAQRRTLAA